MAHEDPRHAAWRSEFESLGEEGVRMMDSGSQAVPDDRIRFSRVWLKERDDSRRSARDDKTHSLAKWANYIAVTALLIAAIAAHKEIKWLISSVMSWLSS